MLEQWSIPRSHPRYDTIAIKPRVWQDSGERLSKVSGKAQTNHGSEDELGYEGVVRLGLVGRNDKVEA